MRRKSEASRARRWAERNSGSWAMKESPSQKLEFSDGGIEVYVYYLYTTVTEFYFYLSYPILFCSASGPRQPAPYTFSPRA